MKQRTLAAEGTILRLMQAAEKAFQDCKYDECFETFERARRMAPANITILADIAGFHVRRHDYPKAQELFERALKLSPNKLATLEDAGRRCREGEAYELAHQYLEQAAAQPKVSAEALAHLAMVYERLRRMEDANAAAERAIQLKPNSPIAILIKARLEHLAGRNAEAEARLRNFTTDRNELHNRVRAAYELGAMLDRQGRYDEAMAAFQQAKALYRPTAPPHLDSLKLVRSRLQALVDGLTPETLQRWTEAGAALQPPARIALLGGHPRSGTTLLEQVVDSHEDIVSAEETDAFHCDAYYPLRSHLPLDTPMLDELEQATTEALQQARQRYLKRIGLFLSKPLGDRLLIDKNPTLTFLVPVFARIFPEIKYLIALRDPRDVCMSCFMQPMSLNQTSAAWLTLEGTANEYVALMGGWRKTMPLLPQPVLEVRYEDMVEDLEPVARKTLDFLGVTWDPKVLAFHEHARQKAVRSPTFSDVTKKVFKTAVGRWRNYQKYFEPYLAKLEPLAKELGYE